MHNIVTSKAKFGLFPECNNEVFAFTAHASQSISGPTGEIPNIAGAQVGQFVLFPVAPEIFDWIEFRGICGKTPGDHLAFQGLKVFPHRFGAMNGRSVPDDKQFSLEVGLKMFEEGDDLRTFYGSWEKPEVEVPPAQAGD